MRSMSWRILSIGRILAIVPKIALVHALNVTGIVIMAVSHWLPGPRKIRGGNVSGSSLLIYSQLHFDPNVVQSKPELLYTGTYSWAKFFFEFMQKKSGSVDYCDFRRRAKKRFNDKKIVVGISSWNFIFASLLNLNSRSIFIAVNSHPIYRNTRILLERKKYGTDLTREWVNPITPILCSLVCDTILLTGNEWTKSTFQKYLPQKKIIPLSGGLLYDQYYPDFSKRSRRTARMIYPTSFCGLRKGVLRFLDLLITAESTQSSLECSVVITGEIPVALKGLIDARLSRINKFRVEFKAWLPHESLREELQCAHIVVACSIEEGQPHGVLEAMACGCVPFVSKDCGLDLPDDFSYDEVDQAKSARRLLALIDNVSADPEARMSSKVLESLKKNNNWESVERKIGVLFED